MIKVNVFKMINGHYQNVFRGEMPQAPTEGMTLKGMDVSEILVDKVEFSFRSQEYDVYAPFDHSQRRY